MKGVIEWEGRFVLLHNERAEWELPGGRIEDDDPSPEAALRRELREELGLDARVGDLLSAYRYDPLPGRPVLIVAYRCVAPEPAQLWHSDEHDDVGLFTREQMNDLALPDGYRRAIDLT